MRVLHLTPELPFAPGGSGGQTFEFGLLRRLAELGHDVLNISPAEPAFMAHTGSLRDVGVESWVAPRPASQPLEALRAMLAEPAILATAAAAPVRALEMRVFWQRLRPLAEQALAQWRPDVALVGHDMAAAWGLGLGHLPKALTLHNLTWRIYDAQAERATGAKRALLRAEAARYRRHVLRALPRYDALVAVSTDEAALLRATGHPHVELIPIGVDTEAIPAQPPAAGPPTLLFTGTMSYPPNAEGIVWFVQEVWPRVRDAVADARLEIVGRNPPEAVTALGAAPGVEVVGPVPSMAPWFARATVVVVPILTGAGIRVKIVEAMSARRAIVSTSTGWEGLAHVEPGRHLLVADSPDAFADAAIALLRDPAERERLAAAARDLA